MGNKTFKSTIGKWTVEERQRIDLAVLQMATDIDRQAKILAPHDTGALANSGRISRKSQANYSITFGGSRVPYARIRHEGGVIRPKNAKVLAWKDKDGDWHYANSVTVKGKKYLSIPGDNISRNVSRYFK